MIAHQMIRPYLDLIKYRSRVIIFLWGSLVGALLAGSDKGIQPLFPTIAGPLVMYLVGLYAYVYNDTQDMDADRINAPNRPLVSGRVTKDQAMKLVIGSAGLALALSLSVNLFVFATALFGIFLGYVYSTPPLSLKNRPIGKWIAGSLWAGVASLGGSLAISGITGKTLYAAVLFVVEGLALMPLADLLDLSGDRAAGKKTMGMLLGPTLAVRMSIALVASTLVFTAFTFNILGFNWLLPIVLGAFSAMSIRWTLSLKNRYQDRSYCGTMIKKLAFVTLVINSSLVVGIL